MDGECCRPLRTFKDLKLNTWLTDQCKTMGLTVPTLVQINCIPPILEGKDCIGCAKTGSGKTLAFALPILQKLSEDPYGIFALILTPTRELAFQIADQFRVFGKPIALKDCIIVGGMDMMIQGKELAQSPHIVISTPGRLADHLESCDTFSLKRIKFLVLDEADRLLEGHFNEQLKTIFEALPKKRQTLLFSATMTQTLEELRNIAMTNPYFWSEPAEVATVEELDQRYVLMPSHVRDAYLVHVVKNFVEKSPKGSVIIFTSTCKSCQILSMAFKSLGFETTALHSMISQRLRLAALASFKSNNVKIMIATDVASRGLDIPQVELVINYNVPSVAKDYVHRVGRTARAGRGGMAVTLVTQYDINLIHAVENLINTKLTLLETKEKEVLNILTQVGVAMREAEIRLDEIDFGEKRMINKRKKLILEGKDPEKEERKKQLRKKLKEKNQRRKQKLRKKEKIKSKQTSKSEDPT